MEKTWREREFLTPKEIANILSIHQNTAYELVNQLPHIRVGRTYRVATAAFEKWIRDQERMSVRA